MGNLYEIKFVALLSITCKKIRDGPFNFIYYSYSAVRVESGTDYSTLYYSTTTTNKE